MVGEIVALTRNSLKFRLKFVLAIVVFNVDLEVYSIAAEYDSFTPFQQFLDPFIKAGLTCGALLTELLYDALSVP